MELKSECILMSTTNARLVSTVWARNGMRCEDLMDSTKKYAEGRFTLKEMETQLDIHKIKICLSHSLIFKLFR
jgi:hypothetical protein